MSGHISQKSTLKMSGKSKELKIIEPQLLDGSTLSVHTIIEEMRDTTALLTVPVKRYSELVVNKVNRMDILSNNEVWVVDYTKTEEKLTATLRLNVYNANMTFCIRRSDAKIHAVDFQTSTENIFTAEIENRQIFDPEEKLLTNDTLVLQWSYRARPQELNIILMKGLQSTCKDLMENPDVKLLCDDLKDLYLSAHRWDFMLEYNSTSFYVHKIILAMSSPFFRQLFSTSTDGCLAFVNCTTDDKMYWMLLYMYSGRLRDLHYRHVIDIYDIACCLEVRSLMTLLETFLKAIIDSNNFKHIEFVITKHEVRDLGIAMRKFIKELKKKVNSLSIDEDIFLVERSLSWMDR